MIQKSVIEPMLSESSGEITLSSLWLLGIIEHTNVCCCWFVQLISHYSWDMESTAALASFIWPCIIWSLDGMTPFHCSNALSLTHSVVWLDIWQSICRLKNELAWITVSLSWNWLYHQFAKMLSWQVYYGNIMGFKVSGCIWEQYTSSELNSEPSWKLRLVGWLELCENAWRSCMHQDLLWMKKRSFSCGYFGLEPFLIDYYLWVTERMKWRG